jgi:hypothetical protein
VVVAVKLHECVHDDTSARSDIYIVQAVGSTMKFTTAVVSALAFTSVAAFAPHSVSVSRVSTLHFIVAVLEEKKNRNPTGSRVV